jgi:N-dimethylarginine dimethylaminohydrolase
MSLTIAYRHPQRPDEAGVVLVPDRAKAAEMKDQLENRGFLVIEIATASFTKARHQSD